MGINILIEDHAVPQLLTSAIEAYEILHKPSLRSKGKDQLETYGLLWGYILPEREEIPATDYLPSARAIDPRIIVTTATIETSAIRDNHQVLPDMQSLLAKRDFMRQYWPHLELVGTFHSHPYESYEDVMDAKGWRASDEEKEGVHTGDVVHWPEIHHHICPNIPFMAHLVVTITQLKKSGSAYPARLPGNESKTGFVLSAGTRKMWIKAYATQSTVLEEDSACLNFSMTDDVQLSIPSLTARIWEGQ